MTALFFYAPSHFSLPHWTIATGF